MAEIHVIFQASLGCLLNHGDQTGLARATGLNVKRINHLATGERRGSEDDRRLIAAALGYPGRQYEDFLDIGRAALGLPLVSRPASAPPPPTPEVSGYLAKARAIIESGGQKAETLKNMIKIMKE